MDENKTLPTDDEMTLGDLSLYMAGQLEICYQYIDLGYITMEDVAEMLDLDIDMLRVNRAVWNAGGVLAQKEVMREMLIEQAKKEK